MAPTNHIAAAADKDRITALFYSKIIEYYGQCDLSMVGLLGHYVEGPLRKVKLGTKGKSRRARDTL